jgi:hypothetical protein
MTAKPLPLNVTGTRKLSRAGIASVQVFHDAGFESEGKDCAVKALQAVTGVPYRDAHQWASVHFGRRNGQGTTTWDKTLTSLSTEHSTIFGYRIFKQVANVGTRLKRIRYHGLLRVPAYQTLESFVRSHRTGRYLVASNNHAWAVIDGIVYDSGYAGARTQCTSVYQLIPSSQCEGKTI